MKNSKANVIKRQQSILQLLRENGTITTEAMARTLMVSPLTIRRDLRMFETQGIIKCMRGGANLISGSLQDDPGQQPASEGLTQSKELIAQRAASYVDDGDMIFINSSSTAILMLKYIVDKHVIVITNNYQALGLPLDPRIELILTGGQIHQNKMSMVGEMALSNLAKVSVSKVFLGVSGISARDGITTCVLQETPINEMMIRRPGSFHAVLADGSKVGSRNNFKCGPIQSISMLITDDTADPGEIYQLREQGVEIVQVVTRPDADAEPPAVNHPNVPAPGARRL